MLWDVSGKFVAVGNVNTAGGVFRVTVMLTPQSARPKSESSKEGFVKEAKQQRSSHQEVLLE